MRPAAGRGAERGFSLVELIVVMTLIGILAAVGVGRMSNNDEQKARTFANDLAQTLGAGQRIAVAQRRPVYVRIVVAPPASVTLCLDAGCATPVPVVPGENAVLSAPSGIGLQTAATAFSFDGMGRPSTASEATFTVLLPDGSSSQMGVKMEAETGHAFTF